MRYTVRQMVFLARPTKVLVCDKRVSSALASLSNFLILNNELSLDTHDPKYTVESHLERCISRRALDPLMQIVAHPGPETEITVKDYFGITKRLRTGIKVNPVPGNTAKFEASTEFEFFRTLGVPLFHASAFDEQKMKAFTIYPSASWKTMVNQKEIFARDDFSYITACINKKLYQCSRCPKEFCVAINYGRHLETHVPAFKSTLNHSWNTDMFAKYWDEISDEDSYSILSDGYQTVEISHGSPVESMMKNWVLSPEFLVAPPEVKGAVKQLRAKKWFADKMVQANVVVGLLSMEENDPSQGLEEKTIDENIEDYKHKDIASIPETSTGSHASDDVHTVPVNKEVPKDKTAGYCHPIYLIYLILMVHKDGSCWNGDWGILDIRVRGDGVTFLIDKMPINATKDGVVVDLQKFIKLLDPYYKLEGIKGPAYFDEFHGDVMSLPDLGSERFETFQKFLGDHMAFMPPLARSDLLERFIKNSIGHALNHMKIAVVQSVEDPVILDLMLAHDLGKFITKLVLEVLYIFGKTKRDETEENDEDENEENEGI
ncbi:uncharacterized protein C2845_PM13G15230 [Panicum miliaceum]|uniref:C2H2-type domain-containing protein n=1 Tax=Panicum miliaceum TaxID=4540 RepID=A0A3L6RJX5_PANMI|nr:uncharacterized protein C2845_PM13G15230 [Panicum miliaceum]